MVFFLARFMKSQVFPKNGFRVYYQKIVRMSEFEEKSKVVTEFYHA